jgi:hypothetical protein
MNLIAGRNVKRRWHPRGIEMKFIVVAGFVASAAVAVVTSAGAADFSYIGTWKLTGAVVAPWADPKQKKPDSAEQSRLIGKTIVFKAREIAGPLPFACKTPRYRQSDYAVDMIFQGAFEQMQSKNKSADPIKLAASLGFPDKTIRTLETGCEIDFHFVDAATAEVGLNDAVYTLKKQ